MILGQWRIQQPAVSQLTGGSLYDGGRNQPCRRIAAPATTAGRSIA